MKLFRGPAPFEHDRQMTYVNMSSGELVTDMHKAKKTRFLTGYTLLEMIVAVGVFSMVMLAATGAYLNLINFDRQTRAVNDIVTNLSFATDLMAREIRTGSGYKCNGTGTNCTSEPGTSFQFTDNHSPARTVRYSLANGQIQATVNGVTSAITDPRITVDSLKFYVRGVGTDATNALIQPQVLFSIHGTMITRAGQTVTFSVESGATQRLLELP